VIVFESTQGTTTNAQGFFKFSVPADKKSLVVSHIGYQTSKLEIPDNNRFLLKLTKEFQVLDPLDIKYFEVKDLPKVNPGPTVAMDPNVLEQNAEYGGGWSYFYNDVARILKKDSIYKTLPDTSRLRFSVEADGSTTFISLTPESSICYNTLQKNSGDFVWTSAIQNNRKVVQYFDLPIRNFEEEIFTVVEEPAMPIGGIASFYKYLGENMKYPAEARRFGVEGKVFVQFIIDRDGTIKDPKIIKGIGGGCDEEVLRLIKAASRWNPGVQKGKPVRQRYTLPVIFSLGKSIK
jgi:TonB family protein